MLAAARELLALEPDGLQLTPGCAPTPRFGARSMRFARRARRPSRCVPNTASRRGRCVATCGVTKARCSRTTPRCIRRARRIRMPTRSGMRRGPARGRRCTATIVWARSASCAKRWIATCRSPSTSRICGFNAARPGSPKRRGGAFRRTRSPRFTSRRTTVAPIVTMRSRERLWPGLGTRARRVGRAARAGDLLSSIVHGGAAEPTRTLLHAPKRMNE